MPRRWRIRLRQQSTKPFTITPLLWLPWNGSRPADFSPASAPMGIEFAPVDAWDRREALIMKTKISCAVAAALLIALAGYSASPAQEEKAAPDPMHIGLVQSFLRDVPQPMVRLMMEPFSALMKTQTGLNGVLEPC